MRRRFHVRTMVYDRAGLGRSAPSPAAYSIDSEASALRRELDRHSVTGSIVLVAHSYGAFVATLVAATDPRAGGLVLVDGNLASFFDEAQLERLLATYTPQFAALEQAAPDLARVLIPIIEAYPGTVERLREVDVPLDLPTVDIVAEPGLTHPQRSTRFAAPTLTSLTPRRNGTASSPSRVAITSCVTARTSCWTLSGL